MRGSIAVLLVLLEVAQALQIYQTRPTCIALRRRATITAMADGDDAPPPAFSFVSDQEKKAEEPPAEKEPPKPLFSFLSDKKEEPKNAVAIQREKDQTFLKQQREFQKNKKDTSYQEGLEKFSLSSAAGDMGDAVESAAIPPAALLFGVVSILAIFSVISTLLSS